MALTALSGDGAVDLGVRLMLRPGRQQVKSAG